MKPGTLISGAAHGALIAAAIFGLPWLSPRDREPVSVTSVSFVTDAEFEAAQSAASAPPGGGEVVLPPEVAEEPPLPVITPPERPAATPAPAPSEAPAEAERAPLSPRFNPEAPLSPPSTDFAAISPDQVSPTPPSAVEAPRPRPVARIAPEPTPPPPDALPEAETVQRDTAPEPDIEVAVPQEDEAAPPETAPEPVAEPAPKAPLALASSARPRSRPEPVSRTQAAAPTPPAPATPEPARETPRETPATPAPSRESQLADLVARATAPTQPSVTPPTEPTPGQGGVSGPPMSAGEKEGLRLAVQRCWNLPAGLRDAQELKVTLAAELTVTGDVISGSIRLVEPNPVPDARYQSAFDAGRRALLRCAPYSNLPADKYGQWRNIEVVFNPEGMVSW